MTDSSTVSGSAVSGTAVSGRLVVALMFAFGALATGTLWMYWYYHTAPFVPLQQAIAAEFPESAPRVDGGARKLHRGTPRLVWIVLRVPFNPQTESDQFESTTQRVFELTTKHVDLKDYDEVIVRLFFGEPERAIHSKDQKTTLLNGLPVPEESVPETAASETAASETAASETAASEATSPVPASHPDVSDP